MQTSAVWIALVILGLMIPLGFVTANNTTYSSLIGDNEQIILEGRLTSSMGFTGKTADGAKRFHKGIDIAAPLGTPIYAPTNGVVSVRTSAGYGTVLTLMSGDIKTIFAHLNSVEVTEGQMVKRGDLIARVGASGAARKAHAHIETFVAGERRNPVQVWQLSQSKVQGK